MAKPKPEQEPTQPAEEKLPGVPSHLQSAVQQLVGKQSPPAKKSHRKR